MREYRKLNESIHVPAGVNQRVLTAARGQEKPKRRGGALRIAVCAACALAVILGGAMLQSGDTGGQGGTAERFYLTASAAEPGANGGLVFLGAETAWAGSTVELTVGQETKAYHLTEERVRTFLNEDGSRVLAPVLTGDTEEAVGLYAVPADSLWLAWPVAGSNTISLSNAFGRRETPAGTVFHAGIDIPGEAGLDIAAAMDGTVTETGFDAERGNYLVIDHGDGLTTLYGQCREVLAAEGETVEAGETVAALGSTGMSTGPHLHFEVRQDGEAQNPVAYFDKSVRDTLQMG